MLVKQPNGIWTVDITINGERVRKSTKTTDKKLAQELHALTEAELVKGAWGLTKAKAKAVSIEQVFQQAARSHWKGTKAEHSVWTNWESIKTVMDCTVGISEVNGLWLNQLTSALMAKGNSAGTVNRKLALMSKLLHLSQDWGYIEGLPKISKMKETTVRHHELTVQEEERMYSYIGTQHKEHLGLFVFLLDMGCRLSEALKLTWDDVTETTVCFSDTKSGANLYKPLTEASKLVLEARRGLPEPFPHNIWVVERIWRGFKAHLGYGKDKPAFVIHCLRHTCASRLAQQGVDLRRIQMWLGHSSFKTTMRYAQLQVGHLDDVAQSISDRNLTYQDRNRSISGGGASDTLSSNPLISLAFLAPRPGFEPGTHGLTVQGKPLVEQDVSTGHDSVKT